MNELGVDIASQVFGIVITHWHTDHIQGAYLLLEACHNAKLYHSLALISNEALNLVSLYKKDVFADTDKELREFSEIVQYLFRTNDRSRLVPVKARHTFFDYRNDIQARLIAISPSDVAVTQALAKLAELKPKAGDSRIRNVVPESANLNAVAIHFSFGGFTALLGSDLEETGNSQTGWSAIFNDTIISELSIPPASLYKVSHHGSVTGHHHKIWEELLIQKPLAVTTPFTRCGLPTLDNITNLQELSSEFLITRDPRVNKKIKRDSMVERELRAIVKERKTVNDKMGHVQVRISDVGLLDIRANENVVSFCNTD